MPFFSKKPDAVLNSVMVSDDQADQQSLEESLQCRVDFRLPNRSLLTGDSVKCLSGRCKDLILDDWREWIGTSLSVLRNF